ncbi:MAG: hypothetical protein EPN57_07055 [Paraburkholderia sp.]|nr:MAG: hypothetical protein EPN57_07055 [Paraburkholderia sp.]
MTRIVVSNNNPDVHLEQWFDPIDARIEVLNQPTASICAKRFELAMHEPFEYFICPDDDLFLSGKQIETLIGLLKAEPDRVHGVFGEVRSFKAGRLRFGGGIHRIECEVDVLNRSYAFTQAHLLRMNELAVALGYRHVGEALYIDDILLSFSGTGRPVCHDLGELAECPSSDEPGVATYLEPGFDKVRMEAYLRLQQLTSHYGRRV